MFWKLAARDAVILATTVLFWTYAAPASAGSGMLADFTGLLTGLGVGASVFLLHEWGHLLGGLATGSVVYAPGSLRSRYLFSFDSKRNDRRQFLVMSLSGFAVTAAALWFGTQVLPDELLATRVARGAIGVLVALTVFLEIPVLVVGLVRRRALPPVEVFRPDEPSRAAA